MCTCPLDHELCNANQEALHLAQLQIAQPDSSPSHAGQKLHVYLIHFWCSIFDPLYVCCLYFQPFYWIYLLMLNNLNKPLLLAGSCGCYLQIYNSGLLGFPLSHFTILPPTITLQWYQSSPAVKTLDYCHISPHNKSSFTILCYRSSRD